MPTKRFEVEIVFRQSVRYAVDAPSRQEAERIALEQWREGDEGAVVDTDCCELMACQAAEVPGEERLRRDADAAFRYLRDRELVIENLDGDAFNPTVHDAVSAEQVAQHLGWKRRGRDTVGIDVGRAARALDALCRARRVVCFTRPRVRAGERGEIRLFCTPQHLEILSALVVDDDVEIPTEAAAVAAV